MARGDTTIQISRETWARLNAEKENPGDSFDDVIQRLLAEDGSSSESAGGGDGGTSDGDQQAATATLD